MSLKSLVRFARLTANTVTLNNPNLIGIVLILFSGVAFTFMGVMMRSATEMGYHSNQVAFLRSIGGVSFAFFFCVVGGKRTVQDFIPQQILITVLRGVFAGSAIVCSVYAIAHIPFAEMTAISFAMPILLTVSAAVIFSESVGIRRATAVVIGFIGVYIVLNPQGGTTAGISLGKWAAIAFVCFATASQVCGKMLCKNNATTLVVFYGALGMTLVSLVLAIPHWQPMDATAWLFLLGMGLLGQLGQLCLAQSINVGEVSVVMPFDYMRLLYGVMAGYFIFGEAVQETMWIGSALIVGAAVYTGYRERKLHKQKTLKAKESPVVIKK